jgi:hypothetical protein
MRRHVLAAVVLMLACSEEEETPTDGGRDASTADVSVTDTRAADTRAPDSSPMDTGPADAADGPLACVPKSGRCSGSQLCCAGLECCSGIPVPAGQEFCSDTCPRALITPVSPVSPGRG